MMRVPATILQIHYHNRPGGVTTVMGLYAQTFARYAQQRPTANIIMCNSSSTYSGGAGRVLNVPAFDYHEYLSKRAFVKAVENLERSITRTIDEPSLPRPICVIGHNLSLGKNCALSAAFAAVARRYANVDDIGFFSVIHDFAEEGRCRQMQAIRRIESWQWPIWQDLYPDNCRIRFVSINRRNVNLLTSAGLPAYLLQNPLDGSSGALSLSPSSRRQISTALQAIALHDGIQFDANRPSYFYPVRLISRKNIIEAILYCCVLCDANLILGLAGESPADRSFCRRLKSVCQTYRLRVVFDASRILNHVPARLCMRQGLVAVLYAYCNQVVSTSIAEGFGYSLFEPWLHKRAVVGRRPMGFDVPRGMEMGHLYTRFEIPVQWISLEKLADTYKLYIQKSFGTKAAPHTMVDWRTQFSKEIVKQGNIDFGVLDSRLQMALLKRIVSSPDLFKPYLMRVTGDFDKHKRRIRGSFANARKKITQNQRILMDTFSTQRFERAFVSCLSHPVPQSGKSGNPDIIKKHFLDLKTYRLLMNPF